MAENPLKSFIIPRFKLPGIVSTVGNKLPQWPHTVVLVVGLNAVVKMNRELLLAMKDREIATLDGYAPWRSAG